MKPGIIGTYHQHLGENGRILGLILDALPNKYLGVSFPIRIYRISFNFCLYNYVLTFYIYIHTAKGSLLPFTKLYPKIWYLESPDRPPPARLI